MADVTGPISTLPGSLHRLPEGTMCDEHDDRPAVARVQGETDSMGSEMNDMCQECLDALRAHTPEPAHCDFCKALADLRPYRDYEEGICGPVYHICAGCRKRRNDQDNEDLAEESRYRDDDCDMGDGED